MIPGKVTRWADGGITLADHERAEGRGSYDRELTLRPTADGKIGVSVNLYGDTNYAAGRTLSVAEAGEAIAALARCIEAVTK